MDKVILQGIVLQCVIGVWPWEREIKQRLLLDAELTTDFSQAAQSDELKDALDYQKVVERVQTVAAESDFKLLEALAESVAALILEEFQVSSVTLTLDKGPAVKGAKSVAIKITRS